MISGAPASSATRLLIILGRCGAHAGRGVDRHRRLGDDHLHLSGADDRRKQLDAREASWPASEMRRTPSRRPRPGTSAKTSARRSARGAQFHLQDKLATASGLQAAVTVAPSVGCPPPVTWRSRSRWSLNLRPKIETRSRCPRFPKDPAYRQPSAAPELQDPVDLQQFAEPLVWGKQAIAPGAVAQSEGRYRRNPMRRLMVSFHSPVAIFVLPGNAPEHS